MPETLDIRRLETFFAEAERVCITVHTHPDGDALCSGVAMLEFPRRCRGKQAVLLLPDAPGAYLDFLAPDGGWQVAEVTRDLHANGPVGVMTDYEKKFYGEGKPICRLTARVK